MSLLAAVGLSTLADALAIRQAPAVWQTLPPTPELPTPINTTLSRAVDGVGLWLQKYNEQAGGTPIVFDHGGLGYSAYFGAVIQRLVANGRYVVAVDRRGHGRSTYRPDDVFTFDMFANDIFAQLSEEGIKSYDVVGWSDGGITTLSMLMNGTIAPGINKAFVFAASMTPEDTNATFADTAVYTEFVTRCATEYAALQPSANFTDFGTKVATLEATQPHFTAAQLGVIDGSKVAIVGADHDEAVNHDVPAKLLAAIPGSTSVTLTGVSHFAPLQDPDQFTKAVESFFAAA
jgi:pimeloyl-ACP methyl ester carboxylesterase